MQLIFRYAFFTFLASIFLNVNSFSQDYYWVGGEGEWSDENNWATQSNGTTFHNSPPGPNNDVYFDQNSFDAANQTVVIDIDVDINSLNWTGVTNNPTLAGNNNVSITVHGQFVLANNMIFDFEGDINFYSSKTNNTIRTGGRTINGSVEFDSPPGTKGIWNLDDDFIIGGSFELKTGDFNSNDHAIECGSNFRIIGEGVANFGKSMISLSISSALISNNSNRRSIFDDAIINKQGGDLSLNNTIDKNNSATLVFEKLVFEGPSKLYITDEDITVGNKSIDATLVFKKGGEIELINPSKAILYTSFLELAGGYNLTLSSGMVLSPTVIKSTGLDCSDLSIIQSSEEGNPAFIDLAVGQQLEFIAFKDIQIRNSVITANNSIDLGGNGNRITFNLIEGTTKYWVGGDGDWYDENHWDITSNGSGGACPPTPLDTVIFDDFSFSGNPSIEVTNIETKDVFWHDLEDQTTNGGSIQLLSRSTRAFGYGSVRLGQNIDIKLDRLYLRSVEKGEEVSLQSVSNAIGNIYFNGAGGWSITSDLNVFDFNVYDGDVAFNDGQYNIGRFYVRGSSKKDILLGSSKINIQATSGDAWTITADNTAVSNDPGSEIRLSAGTSMRNQLDQIGNNVIEYGAVYFEIRNLNALSTILTDKGNNYVSFNKLVFESDGELIGSNIMDSLVFAPYRTYTFDSDGTQNINTYWFMLGSACEGSITLQSSLPGSQANVVSKSSLQLLSDFVEIQDIAITPNKPFDAGANSIDLGNNSGWTFGNNANSSDGFLGPDKYLCQNTPTSLINPKTGSYEWAIYDPNSDVATIMTGEVQSDLVVNTPGYYISNVSIAGACIISDTIEVLSTDFLDSIDLGMDLTLCEGESQTFNINIPNYPVDFVWNDNPSNNLQNFTVSKPGQLKVEGTFEGCIRSDSIDITIDSVVTPTLPSTISLCFGEVINLPFDVSPYTLIEWENPNGVVSLITTNDLMIDQGGTYNLKVYNNNCFKTTSVLVTAQPELVVNLGGDKTLCEGELIELDAGNPGASFIWSGPISATSPKIQPVISGNYKVEVTLNGCTASDSVAVVFNTKPIVALDPTYVFCEGDAVTIQADNPLISSGANLTWSDGSTGNSISVNSAGRVRLTADLNGCIAEDSAMVSMQTLPLFNIFDSTLCEGESILLDATQGNSATTYEWIDLNNPSLGTTSTDPTLLVQDAGQYQVTADILGCQNTATANIQFTTIPVFDLGKDTVLCSGDPPISFDFSNVNGDSYLWSTNNTTALTQISSTGFYWLEIQKGSCIVRDSIQVVNQAKPTLNLSDQTLCAGDTFALDAGQSNPLTTYEWIDANNGNLLGTDPIYVVRGAGTYQITASILGCSSTQQVVATYNPIPTNLNLGPDTVLCEGQSLTFDQSNINADAYQWSNGDITPQIIVQPSLSTNYTLTITVNGCKASDAIQVDVQPFPILNLGNDTTMCDGELLVLDATQPYPNTNYDWQDISGGLPNALGSNPTLNVDQSGQFEITASVNGCSSSANVGVTFNPYPKLELGNDTTLCEGESIIVGTSILPTATYLWLDDNSTLPTRTLNQTGNYILQVTDNNCATTDSIEVEVIQFTPNFLGANQNNLCDGEQIDLKVKDTFPGITYLWNDGSTSSFLQVTQSGEYWVEINVDRCFIRDSIVFEFNPLPIFDLGLDQRLCEDETINLTITAGSSTFNWSDGTSQATNTIRYPGGLIWAEAQNLYCSFRDSIFVDYDEYPLIDLGPDTTICDDRSVILSAGANAEKFAWSTGSTASSVEVDKSGIYALTATNGVCEITDDVEVISRECYYFNVFVPNAFSPNNDGVNDNIVPYFPLGVSIQEFSMSILDRWGNILFQTNDINTTWDGYWNGQLMPGGVYIYYLEVSYVDDLGPGTARRNGDFILIK